MDDLIERLRELCAIEGRPLTVAERAESKIAMSQAAAALEAAREDCARLDWLDANGFTAYRDIDPIDGLSGHAVVVHETQRPRRGNVADTIRQAIDQARGKGGAQ